LLVRALSFAVLGIDAVPVEVETDIATGCLPTPSWGSPERGPGKRRPDPGRRAELRTPFPGRKVTVNLAPADLRKDGSLLDLPIACRCSPPRASCRRGAGRVGHRGELSLDGTVRPIPGPLQAILARNLRIPGVITPSPTGTRRAWCRESGWSRSVPSARRRRPHREEPPADGADADPGGAKPRTPTLPLPISRTWSANRWRAGPWRSRRRGAMAMLLVGPPGAEKRCSPNDLQDPPDLSASKPSTRRALRSGGEPPWPRPLLRRPSGRLTRRSPRPVCWGRDPAPAGRDLLRPCGVLFLDEFSNSTPTSGRRSGSRSNRERSGSPDPATGTGSRAGSWLLAATNPCPCGNAGHPGRCAGAPRRSSIVSRENSRDPSSTGSTSRSPCSRSRSRRGPARRAGESSAAVRRRVEACRTVQEARYAGRVSRTNGTVRSGTADLLRELTPEAAAFLTRAAERLSLSGRAIGKRAAWRGRSPTSPPSAGRAPHAAEALQYRLSGFG